MLKKLLTFSTLTLSLNVTSVDDISQFNKRPTLNLNQEYSFDNQAIAQGKAKDDSFDSLFKDAFSSIRDELRLDDFNSDLDNDEQLDKKTPLKRGVSCIKI
jgi:hypothetical protein